MFGLIARDRAAIAGSRELAARANAMLPFDPAESRRLAERAESRKRTHEAVAALQEAVIADRLLVATHAGGERSNPPNVGAVAYTPDGRWLITGGDDGRIRLWDGVTAEPRSEAQTDQEVRSLAVDRAGRRLVVGTTATVQLWDLACLTAGRRELSRWTGDVSTRQDRDGHDRRRRCLRKPRRDVRPR